MTDSAAVGAPPSTNDGGQEDIIKDKKTRNEEKGKNDRPKGTSAVQAPEKAKEDIALPKVLPPDIGLQTHRYRMFSAAIAKLDDPETNLTNPEVWTFVAKQLNVTDEIRVIDGNTSWMARLLVTYKFGTQVRLKLLEFHSLDDVGEENASEAQPFFPKLRGQYKWCIMDRATNKPVKENIPTQAEAYKEITKLMERLE